MAQGFLAREQSRCVKAERAREHVVKFQSRAVEKFLPRAVRREDERDRVDEMRRIAQQQPALAQRLAHEAHVALLEITKAAVDELGAAAGCSFCEVALFEQCRAIAARGGVHRRAEAGRAAADDKHVPLGGLVVELLKGLRAIHGSRSSHAFERESAFVHPAKSFLRAAGFIAGTKRRSACHCCAISF